jgi:tRNA(Arg) A34 adenosine deaminase TadA
MEITENDKRFMRRAIELALIGVNDNDGGPFGCVIVRNGEIIGEGRNLVTSTNDPTAHAEIVAIRNACSDIGSFQLDNCTIYTSCEPCPMCLGAIYWSRAEQIFIGCTREEAAAFGFDDAFIYDEIAVDPAKRSIPIINILNDEAIECFNAWGANPDKIEY